MPNYPFAAEDSEAGPHSHVDFGRHCLGFFSAFEVLVRCVARFPDNQGPVFVFWMPSSWEPLVFGLRLNTGYL